MESGDANVPQTFKDLIIEIPCALDLLPDYIKPLLKSLQNLGTIIEERKNQPIYLASTIPGFREGCIKVRTHGDIHLYIPAHLGYDYDTSDGRGAGTEGYKTYIPPYSTLIYEIHICSFY